jgi:hypothetical protein
MSKRTPGPYSTEPGDRRQLAHGERGEQFIRGPDGIIVAEVFDDERDPDRMGADAAFIVRACNAFDGLVAACEQALRFLCGENLPFEQEQRLIEGIGATLRAAVRQAREG